MCRGKSCRSVSRVRICAVALCGPSAAWKTLSYRRSRIYHIVCWILTFWHTMCTQKLFIHFATTWEHTSRVVRWFIITLDQPRISIITCTLYLCWIGTRFRAFYFSVAVGVCVALKTRSVLRVSLSRMRFDFKANTMDMDKWWHHLLSLVLPSNNQT